MSKSQSPGDREVDEALAAVIANTKRRARKLDPIAVAENIEVARQGLGSLQAVAERATLSYEMVRQIHSILRCAKSVKRLARQGRLGSFDVLHRLGKLPGSDQEAVARAVADRKVDSDDVRGIVNLRRDFPDDEIDALIRRIRESRDVRHYVAFVKLQEHPEKERTLRSRFARALGRGSVVSLAIEGTVAVLTLNAAGAERLREEAKARGLTKRRFLEHVALKGKR